MHSSLKAIYEENRVIDAYIDIFEEYDTIVGLTENLNFEVGTEEEEQVYMPVFEEDEEGNIKVFKTL